MSWRFLDWLWARLLDAESVAGAICSYGTAGSCYGDVELGFVLCYVVPYADKSLVLLC